MRLYILPHCNSQRRHLSLTTLVAAFLFWNSRNAAVFFSLHSIPDPHGQITGVVSCGNVSLESSYEKVRQCAYTSTVLYERRYSNVRDLCVLWRVAYSERLSTDFYITELKSGIRALVKAGPGSQVIPLINQNKLIETTRKCRLLSTDFSKWLRDRNLSAEARLLCLQEGYINEGSCISVVGVLHKNKDDVVMIVQPPESISTGCLWSKLLLPVDVEGLIIGVPETTDQTNCNNTPDGQTY